MSLLDWLFIIFVYLHLSGQHHFAWYYLAAPLVIQWLLDFGNKIIAVYLPFHEWRMKWFKWLLKKRMDKSVKQMEKEGPELTAKLAQRMADIKASKK